MIISGFLQRVSMRKREGLKDGVGEGARTLDRRNHNPELCQLSYAHHQDLVQQYISHQRR